MKKIPFLFLITFMIKQRAFSQAVDSVNFDYHKIYVYALDGNISPVFPLLEYNRDKKISEKDLAFKHEFEDRFKYETDKSDYLMNKNSSIDSLLVIFHNYWRQSLLDNKNDYSGLFIKDYRIFLKTIFPNVSDIEIEKDSTDFYLQKYLSGKQLFTTKGIGKTGRLYDLLVWKTQKDTTYTFKIHNELLRTRVVFMDNFITLGWEEYATLGKYYPGGWTSDAIYCVKTAYDVKNEKFLVSLLAHEGRHYSDKKLFPKLSSTDLEYRAKLTELSISKKSIYSLIDFFIDNANYQSDNGHNVADYCVIRDLSKKLFKVDFETSRSKWKEINVSALNKLAYKILQRNTRQLKSIGTSVEKFIKQ